MLETKDLILKRAVFEDWQDLYHNVWRHWETARFMLWTVTESEEAAQDRMRRTLAWQATHDHSYTVYDMYRIERTCLYAVSAAKASEVTAFRSASGHK